MTAVARAAAEQLEADSGEDETNVHKERAVRQTNGMEDRALAAASCAPARRTSHNQHAYATLMYRTTER